MLTAKGKHMFIFALWAELLAKGVASIHFHSSWLPRKSHTGLFVLGLIQLEVDLDDRMWIL